MGAGSYNTPGITIGPSTGTYLEMSPNRIISKAIETTGANLFINYGTSNLVYLMVSGMLEYRVAND